MSQEQLSRGPSFEYSQILWMQIGWSGAKTVERDSAAWRKCDVAREFSLLVSMGIELL